MLLKRLGISFISFILIFTMIPITALAKTDENKTYVKDEVIYANLSANGNVNDMYVVNSFQIDQAGQFIDYGTYDNVRNLTDLTDVTIKNENEVHFKANEEFYYQGALKKQSLPWDISISYLLDGEKMEPKDLLGASGELTIQIETKKNEDIDPTFFEYYLLQVNLTFDPLHFKNIIAPKGTEANEGKNKLMTFSVMPDKEEVMIVTTDVTDFKMEPIEMSAVPANIGFESPDTKELSSDMQALSNAIRDINDGVAELEDGATELSKGAFELSNGSDQFLNGINELNNSSDQLINGSEEILNAFNQINQMLGNIPEMPSGIDNDLKQIPETLNSLSSELRNIAKFVGQIQTEVDNLPDITLNESEIEQLIQLLNDINTSIQENQFQTGEDNEEIDEDLQADLEKKAQENKNLINEQINQSIKRLELMGESVNLLDGIKTEVPNDAKGSIIEMANEIDKFSQGIDGAMGSLSMLDDLNELTSGLSQFATEYKKFHNGLVAYTDGVNQLATSYNELNQGTHQLAKGTSDLKDGISQLQDGTQELREETKDLSGQLESEIDKFMEDFDFSDFEPLSFVSDLNKNIGVVQFVFQTEAIEKDEPEDKPKEEEPPKNFWDRFLDLFR